MKIYFASPIRLSCILLATGLTACGGGGTGAYTAPAAANPAAPATFAQPATATTIDFGQGVTLQWSSTNSTGCMASASAATAGNFTGSQSLSGTAMVVPTAPGTYSYTLNCTGTGGNASVTTAVVTVSSSILTTLSTAGTITTIGSTVDPINGDQNPYGLMIAPATAGLITKRDLIVCNFNDASTPAAPGGVQGTGTTIVGLHPGAGTKPYRIAQSASLDGCDALTMLPDDSISAAAWSATANPLSVRPESSQHHFQTLSPILGARPMWRQRERSPRRSTPPTLRAVTSPPAAPLIGSVSMLMRKRVSPKSPAAFAPAARRE